jgi:DNA-binding transcriptional MerR regulator
MREVIDRNAYRHRPIKSGTDAAESIRFEPDIEFVMRSSSFMKVMGEVYGLDVSRRTLQLYSSPQLQLLPPPVHKGGHISFYLHPEHTERLAAILHLSEKQFMPLKAIRKLLRVYPPRYYRLLLKNVLTTQELTDFHDFSGQGLELKDFLFNKICRVLMALDEDYDDPVGRDEAMTEKALFSMARQFEKWLNSDRRAKIEATLQYDSKD